MKNFKNKETLQILLLVVIAVVTLGIGYAAISAVNLIINGKATESNYSGWYCGIDYIVVGTQYVFSRCFDRS